MTAAQQAARAQQNGAVAMTATEQRGKPRWEYMVLPQMTDPTANLATLNKLGAIGWELIAIGKLEYILKRRAE